MVVTFSLNISESSFQLLDASTAGKKHWINTAYLQSERGKDVTKGRSCFLSMTSKPSQLVS